MRGEGRIERENGRKRGREERGMERNGARKGEGEGGEGEGENDGNLRRSDKHMSNDNGG